jgi:peptide/nickel transport system substrate-binding protein
MFKQKWCALLVLGLVLLLAACGGGAQPEVEQPADAAPAQDGQAEEAKESTATGGTVHVGWGGAPDTLNPGTAVVAESYTLFQLIYDTLVNVKLDGTYAPGLAESWEASDDGKVYTFKIHKGVKFHDGQPLTAKDVVFSFNFYHAHEDFLFLNVYTEPFESVEATDDTTIVVKLTNPVPSIEYYVSALFILPEHIWSKHSEGNAATEYENPEMIGSGPFKLVEYKQNQSVRLAANKEHFLTPPNVDEVTFQTFGNQDALVQALQTGQVD